MGIQNIQTVMDQRIFELGLSTETVSVYLLCTGLADTERPLTFDLLQSVWNGPEEDLSAGLDDLIRRGIVRKHSDPPVYVLMPGDQWDTV